MAPGLLDMPEVVMTKIMVDSGFKAILTLRKVCHDLRNFVDDVQFAKLEEICLTSFEPSHISVRYQYPGGFQYVQYIKHEEGCLIKTRSRAYVKDKLLKNEDFLTVCMKDFEIALGHQKSVLKQFALTGGNYREDMDERIIEDLLRVLKLKDHPLKVEKFPVVLKDQNQIMSILPLLDSKTLNTLLVRFNDQQSKVDQLIESDHWKNVKHIVFATAIDLKYIQYFTHFSTARVIFKSEDFPDLTLLKNYFLQWPGFKTITVRPNISNISCIQRSIDLLGQPILEVNTDRKTKHVWYYRIPNTKQVLEIYLENRVFSFNAMEMEFKLSRIEESSVPQNDVIQN